MAKRLLQQRSFLGGISDSLKSPDPGVVAFERALDFRSDPFQITINPQAERQAAGIINDLILWWDLACGNLYGVGSTGNVYLKNNLDVWSIDHTSPNASGNGLAYFPEDGYLYEAQDTTIARKSRACDTDGVWYDGFLESEGGEPTNSQSITFLRASSQYASIADNASLSITDDISLESYVKFTSLPASTEVQTLISKWNENGNQRSYKFDLTTSTTSFGDGSDGALHITTDTTDAPIDSTASGTMGSYSLAATNASFAAGQKILIIQMQGTNYGQKQHTTIRSYTAGTITTVDALTVDFSSSGANKAQVIVRKQYSSITVDAGKIWSCKAWNPSTGLGGVLTYCCSGTRTNNGTISVLGKGFLGGFGGGVGDRQGRNGEGVSGIGQSATQNANSNGGGGGTPDTNAGNGGAGGGGGGHSAGGIAGSNQAAGTSNGKGGFAGAGGINYGVDGLSTMIGGGGGGEGGIDDSGATGTGGNGGGMLDLTEANAVNSGLITYDGAPGLCVYSPPSTNQPGGGGGGAAGSYFQEWQTGTFGTVSGVGGVGASGSGNGNGGAGANGRSALSYGTSYTGSIPTGMNIVQNTTLSATTGYVLRLLISSNGTNVETYTQDVTSVLQAGVWNRWAVTWDAPTSTAHFYQNAVLLGTQIGTLTAIFNSTARFALATSYDSGGTAHDFLNAKMDDTRVWNSERSGAELAFYNDRVLAGTETNNSAYYKFEGNLNDSQTYTTTSNLIQTNTPTYSTDVPFAGVTTRADQDILINALGSTYTLGTVLSEAATDRQTFTPTKEPIKSIEFNINTVGSGNWTVVIHDGLNRTVDTLTVVNAQLHTGIYEFVFTDSFRPILFADYHIHVYSTVGDGKIVTSSLNDMEGSATPDTGAYFATFFQILVDDIYHPMKQFLNFLAVGNERYVAKLEAGNLYNPHQLTLPAGYRVRCFADWNEFLAIGVWKGDSITDTDQGKIFLWDGSSDTSGLSTPNTKVDVLEGGVNAMQGGAGILSVVAGYEGKLLQYGGGETQKVSQLPLIGRSEYGEIAPGAMTLWRSLLYIGATLNTNSTTVHQGIYSYGRLNQQYPQSLGFEYPLSLGDQQSSMVKIGAIFPAGQSLYVSWQNGNAFGVDKIAVTNDCYPTATLETCVIDLGRMTQLKLPLVFRADFEALETGQSITIKYKADRESSWNILEIEDTSTATTVRGVLHTQVKEVQFAVDIATTTGETPVLIQAGVELDDQGTTILV